MASHVRSCTPLLRSQTRMEVRGSDRKEPGLRPGELQVPGGGAEPADSTPSLPWQSQGASQRSHRFPCHIHLAQATPLNKVPLRPLQTARCYPSLSHPSPSVGHTAVIQASWVTVQSPGEMLLECPSEGVTKALCVGVIKYSLLAPSGRPGPWIQSLTLGSHAYLSLHLPPWASCHCSPPAI